MTESILGQAKLQQIRALALEVRRAGVPGHVAECGVYKGGTLKLLSEVFPDKSVFGFDTFQGLPAEDYGPEELHKPGEFADTGYGLVKSGLAEHHNVVLMPGYFPVTAFGLEDEVFSFVHVDFDYEKATEAAIDWFLPRLSPGAVMVFDDYGWDHTPGVVKAIAAADLDVVETVRYQAVYRHVG